MLLYKRRGIEIPKPREGIIYKNMGVQENQNCTIVTIRMKGNRKRWSMNGANHLVKVLYKKANKELMGTINKVVGGELFNTIIEEIIREVSVSKSPKKEGKGNIYIDLMSAHMPLGESIQTLSTKILKKYLYKNKLDLRLIWVT